MSVPDALAAAAVAACNALREHGHELGAMVLIVETADGTQQMAAHPAEELRKTWELLSAATLAVEESVAHDARLN